MLALFNELAPKVPLSPPTLLVTAKVAVAPYASAASVPAACLARSPTSMVNRCAAKSLLNRTGLPAGWHPAGRAAASAQSGSATTWSRLA
ncbi:hypothetical protein [Micromonospora sp. NPDC047134]|uniref:hypothetical protein n=1 Tax=Micromonospora sp. NPDC047134 TaxID=3154340 RepID=UPI0033D2A39A